MNSAQTPKNGSAGSIPTTRPRFERIWRHTLGGKTSQFECKYRIRHRDGRYIWMLGRGLAVADAGGKATEIAGSQTDITALVEVETRLIRDALHDQLTGLPNRSYLTTQLEKSAPAEKVLCRPVHGLRSIQAH